MWDDPAQDLSRDSSASYGGHGNHRGLYHGGVKVVTEPMDAATLRNIREAQWTSFQPLTDEEIILRHVASVMMTAAYDSRNLVAISISPTITFRVMEDGKIREKLITVDLKWLADEMKKRGYQTKIKANGPGFAHKQSLRIVW